MVCSLRFADVVYNVQTKTSILSVLFIKPHTFIITPASCNFSKCVKKIVILYA